MVSDAVSTVSLAASASRSAPDAITLGDVLDAFVEVHVMNLKQPAPVLTRIRLYFEPIRHRPLASLTVLDLERWAQSIRAVSKAQAIGCISILRTMYRMANIWGLYKGENVAPNVRKGRLTPRKRYILAHEQPTLLASLAACSLDLQCYVGLIYQTGCRPGEAAAMKRADLSLWQDRDGHWQGNWTKPTTKTDEAHTVPIPSPLAALLAVWLAHDHPSVWVFPGRRGIRPRSKAAWYALWNDARRHAHLPDVRLHDLRRSCSTDLLNGGMDLITLSKGVLNHSSVETTKVYALPDLERVRTALNARADRWRQPS
jgi:integrase